MAVQGKYSMHVDCAGQIIMRIKLIFSCAYDQTKKTKHPVTCILLISSVVDIIRSPHL